MAAADPLVLGNGLSRVSHHLTVGLSRWTGTRGRIRVIAESGHFSATFVDSLTTICIKARVQTQHCELGGVHKSFCYSDRGAPIAGFGRFCQVFRFFASPSPAGALFDSRNDRLPVNWFTPFRIGLFRVFSGCPVDPCAIMQFLWDRYRPLRSSLAADRAPASHKSLITFMLA